MRAAAKGSKRPYEYYSHITRGLILKVDFESTFII